MSKGRFEELLFSGAGGLAPGGGTEEALRLNNWRHTIRGVQCTAVRVFYFTLVLQLPTCTKDFSAVPVWHSQLGS